MRPHTIISEHPAAESVAHAATADDLAQIDIDVKRNLKLWGAVEAFRNGQLPSNHQLDKILRRVARRCTIKDQSVCSETIDACTSLRGLLETLRLALRDKNADELMQQTAWLVYRESQTGSDAAERVRQRAELEAQRRAEPPSEPVLVDSDGESLATVETTPTEAAEIDDAVDATATSYSTGDGQLVAAARNVRKLAAIFFTSPELRGALSDLVVVVRQMVQERKTDAAGDSEKAKTAQADVAGEQSSEPTPEAAEQEPPTTDPQIPTSAPEPEAATSSFHLHFLNKLFQDAADAVGSSGSTPQPPGAYYSDADEPDSEYDDAEEEPQTAAPEINGIMDDPRLAECAAKLKFAIVTLQEQEGYTTAMAWLLDTFQAYETATLLRSDRAATPHNPTPIEHILTNIATLLERFARGRSLGPVQNAVRKIYEQANADPELRALWVDIDEFIRTALLEPGFIASNKCSAIAEALWQRIRTRLSDEVSAAQWKLLSSSMSSWLGMDTVSEGPRPPASQWFPDDPVTRALSEGWAALTSTLFLDGHGRMVFKRALWEDIIRLTFPSLQGMGYLPLPRVEFMSPAMEVVMENVFISVANILPTMVSVKLDESAKWSPFDQLQSACLSSRRQRVQVHVEQVQADVRGMLVALKFKKLNFQDTGVVDVLLSRRGLSIDLDLDIDPHPDSTQILTARNISVNIDELNVNIIETASGYKWLYPLLLKIAIPLLKARMKARLTQRLEQGIQRASDEMVEIRRRIKASTPGVTTTGRLSEIVFTERDGASRILRIVIQRLKELKHEADANRALPRKKKWKFSSRIEDALFPNTTQDPEKSIEYRRQREELRARVSALGANATRRRTRMVTDAGLRGAEAEAWRSSVYSFQ